MSALCDEHRLRCRALSRPDKSGRNYRSSPDNAGRGALHQEDHGDSTLKTILAALAVCGLMLLAAPAEAQDDVDLGSVDQGMEERMVADLGADKVDH